MARPGNLLLEEFADFAAANFDNPAAVYARAYAVPELANVKKGDVNKSRTGDAIEKNLGRLPRNYLDTYLAAGKAGVEDWPAFQRGSIEFALMDDASLADTFAVLLNDPLKFYDTVNTLKIRDLGRIAFALGKENREINGVYDAGSVLDEERTANMIANMPSSLPAGYVAPGPRDENQYGMTAYEVAQYENIYASSGYIGGPEWVAMSPDMRAAIMSGNIDVNALTPAQRGAIPSALVMYGVPEGMTLEEALDGGVLPVGYGQPTGGVAGGDSPDSISDAQISQFVLGVINGGGSDAAKARAILAEMAKYPDITISDIARATGYTVVQITGFLAAANADAGNGGAAGAGNGGGAAPPQSPLVKWGLTALSIYAMLKGL